MKKFVNDGCFLGKCHSRGNLLAVLAFALVTLSQFACTDYVSQIEDDRDEWRLAQKEKAVSSSSETASSSSAKSNSGAYDCSVTDGVKVVYPAGGETFNVGDEITVVFGTAVEDNGYRIIFKNGNSDLGMDLLNEYVEAQMDGKTCNEVRVKLFADRGVEATSTGIIRVAPYNWQNKGANSETFNVVGGKVKSSSSVLVSSSSFIVQSSSDNAKSSSSVLSSSSIAVAPPCKTKTADNCEYGLLEDERDGQKYKTVKIGTQTWMAENLNYEAQNSKCTASGCLYVWAVAMDSIGEFSNNSKGCGYNYKGHGTAMCSPVYPVRGICPEGWHLPTSEEFRVLIKTVGGGETPEVLQSLGISGWPAATDSYGFSAIPIMVDWESRGSTADLAVIWGVSIDLDDGRSESLGINTTGIFVYPDDSGPDHSNSIRCLKD